MSVDATAVLLPVAVGLAGALGIGLFGVAAFRAFRVRTALLVPLYRNQALWIGTAGIYWIVFYLLDIPSSIQLLGTSGNPTAVSNAFTIVLFAALYFGLVLFFAWIDTMVGVARNSDPRGRDPLSWKRLRLVMYGVIALGIFWGSYSVAPAVLNHDIGLPIDMLVTFYAYNSPVFFLTSGLGVVALISSALRSEDPMLRKQLRWLGLYVLILFINVSAAVVTVYVFGGSLSTLGTSLLPIVMGFAIINFALGFSLYQAARSLVPTSKF